MEQRCICPYCMQELEAGEEQCPHCGRELAGRTMCAPYFLTQPCSSSAGRMSFCFLFSAPSVYVFLHKGKFYVIIEKT